MITNLVFKRTANIEGYSRTEMKIIEVMIPELKSNEGWTLVSSADKVDQVKIQECRAIPPETTAEQAEEDAAIAEFLKTYREEKEEKRKKLMIQLAACSCSGKPDPSITAYNGCSDNVETVNANELQGSKSDSAVSGSSEYLEDYKNECANDIKVAVKPKIEPREYPSPIDGTACLIRCKNRNIRIAYREGKNSNINTPNKVCISNADKQHFFNAVRAANGGSDVITSWTLTPNDPYYDHWNKLIDDEYFAQRKEYLRKERIKK